MFEFLLTQNNKEKFIKNSVNKLSLKNAPLGNIGIKTVKI